MMNHLCFTEIAEYLAEVLNKTLLISVSIKSRMIILVILKSKPINSNYYEEDIILDKWLNFLVSLSVKLKQND